MAQMRVMDLSELVSMAARETEDRGAGQLPIPEAQAEELKWRYRRIQELKARDPADIPQPGDLCREVEGMHMTDPRRIWIVLRYLDHDVYQDRLMVRDLIARCSVVYGKVDVLVGNYEKGQMHAWATCSLQLEKWHGR